MSFLDEAFDLDDLPESENSYDPIPEGWYEAVINKAELKKTKDGTGTYINVRYDIVGPTHQGRVVFSIITVKNKSAIAQNIGLQNLKQLMRAIGIKRVDDTDQLIGGRLSIKVVVRTQEGYEPSNDVRGYKAIEGAVMPTAASTPAAAPATGDKKSPPWAKK